MSTEPVIRMKIRINLYYETANAADIIFFLEFLKKLCAIPHYKT